MHVLKSKFVCDIRFWFDAHLLVVLICLIFFSYQADKHTIRPI